jgi:hypothetical protein
MIAGVEHGAGDDPTKQERKDSPVKHRDVDRIVQERQSGQEQNQPEGMRVALDAIANVEYETVSTEKVVGVSKRDHRVVDNAGKVEDRGDKDDSKNGRDETGLSPGERPRQECVA